MRFLLAVGLFALSTMSSPAISQPGWREYCRLTALMAQPTEGRAIIRTALVNSGYATDTAVAERLMSDPTVIIGPLFIYYAERPPEFSMPGFERMLATWVTWIIEENNGDIEHLLRGHWDRLSNLVRACDR
jgi:hypothetical protein